MRILLWNVHNDGPVLQEVPDAEGMGEIKSVVESYGDLDIVVLYFASSGTPRRDASWLGFADYSKLLSGVWKGFTFEPYAYHYGVVFLSKERLHGTTKTQFTETGLIDMNPNLPPGYGQLAFTFHLAGKDILFIDDNLDRHPSSRLNLVSQLVSGKCEQAILLGNIVENEEVGFCPEYLSSVRFKNLLVGEITFPMSDPKWLSDCVYVRGYEEDKMKATVESTQRGYFTHSPVLIEIGE